MLAYSSDDEEYENYIKHRLPSKEDTILYNQQIEQSQGYDVDVFSKGFEAGWIQPWPYLDCPDHRESFVKQLMPAIEVYNNNNEAKIKFSNLVKVTGTFLHAHPKYFTFEATDEFDGKVKTYQARVCDKRVEEVRLKPQQNQKPCTK